MLREPVEGGAEVLVVSLETIRPFCLRLEAPLVPSLGERGERLGVPRPHFLGETRLVQSSKRVLADGLQQQKAVVADRFQQARIDKCPERFELGSADGLGDVDRERAREHREMREERFARIIEEVIAPRNRRLERPLALGGVAGTAGQERKGGVEPAEKGLRGEEFRACRSKLDRKGKPVQATADQLDRRIGCECAAGGA